MERLKGLIPAALTPMKQNGDIYPEKVEDIINHLESYELSGVYVCGSTGEGTSITVEEKKEIFKAYTEFSETLPVIVQVGDDCIRNSVELAEYASKINVDGISALPPRYFAPENPMELKSYIQKIASIDKDLPFYYYHFPGLSGVDISMFELLKVCDGDVQNFQGIKYSQNKFPEMLKCIEYKDEKYNIFHGLDQTLLNGLAMGTNSAIGSGYNFAAPLYNDLIESFNNGKLKEAKEYQSKSIKLMDLLMNKYRGHPSFKAMMKILGVDCGPTRSPLRTLDSTEIINLEQDLKKINFFNWIRS